VQRKNSTYASVKHLIQLPNDRFGQLGELAKGIEEAHCLLGEVQHPPMVTGIQEAN
jgi:hypothetical protein